MMFGYGMGIGLLGLAFMILFWGAVIGLGVWFVKAIISGNRSIPFSENHGPSARDILDQRYSRGEISRDQYEQMKGDIQ
jgi:putative membrane protein